MQGTGSVPLRRPGSTPWRCGPTDKDVDALGKVLADTGTSLTSLLAGPRMSYTLPGVDLEPFFDGVQVAVDHARQLGCPRVVLASGMGFPGMNRSRNHQVLIDLFGQAVERTERFGVRLILEPVNTRRDHPVRSSTAPPMRSRSPGRSARTGSGSSTTSTTRSSRERTRRPHWRTRRAWSTTSRSPTCRAAASPAAALDWTAQLAVLRASGYDGPIGLEYFPTVPTEESVQLIRSIAAGA